MLKLKRLREDGVVQAADGPGELQQTNQRW